MKKVLLPVVSLLVLSLLALSACSALPSVQAAAQAAALQAPVLQTQPTQAPAANPAPASTDGVIAAYQGALTNVYQQVSPSVVNINIQAATTNGFGGQNAPQYYNQGLGSGFVWDTQGHIVTNNHVVENADRVEVVFNDGTTAPAEVVGTDPDSDLAVVKVSVDPSLLHPVQLARSQDAQVGQLAIAIGNPFGLSGTMTVGVISALGRSLPVGTGQTTYSIPEIIQTDAPINPGNSGGVLVNIDGQVLGVTTAIESASGANAGIGFVVPADIVSRVVPVLIQTGNYQQAWLGISGMSLNASLNEQLGLDPAQRGVLVASVIANGPAAQAGLQAGSGTIMFNGQQVPSGSDIITAVDGQPLQDMEALISYLVLNTEPGQTVALTVLRNGQPSTLNVTLGARPETTGQEMTQALPQIPGMPQVPMIPQVPDQQTPQQQAPTTRPRLGIQGTTVTADMVASLNLPVGTQGVLVEQVQSDSAASAAGLQAGDVITGLGGQFTPDLNSLRAVLAEQPGGEAIAMNVLRNGQAMMLSVTFGE